MTRARADSVWSALWPVLILLLAAYGVAGLCSSPAHGSTPVRVFAAVGALPQCWADRELPPEVKRQQLETIARAVDAASTNRNERALLLTIAHHESAMCHDVHAGFCAPGTCDPDRNGVPRARTIYQTHRLGLAEADWDALVGTDYEATLKATQHALRQVRRSYGMCRDMPDPIWSTFLAYAGKGCGGHLKDLIPRMITFERVLRRL